MGGLLTGSKVTTSDYAKVQKFTRDIQDTAYLRQSSDPADGLRQMYTARLTAQMDQFQRWITVRRRRPR